MPMNRQDGFEGRMGRLRNEVVHEEEKERWIQTGWEEVDTFKERSDGWIAGMAEKNESHGRWLNWENEDG